MSGAPGPRGRVGAYWIAFGLMLLAAALLAVRLPPPPGWIRASAGLSVTAIAVALWALLAQAR